MCPGTFGCLIRAVGYVMNVTLSSQYLTGGIIVDFVAEFSVPSVLQTLFLPHLMSKGLEGKIGRGLGSVIIASGNGSKG